MPGRRVLVTRPEPQATATAALLAARGHLPFKCPLARIERLAASLPSADEVDAVLLTSANAVHALTPYRGLPVFTVGDSTARAARAAGVRQVTAADGDWRSLARLLAGPAGPGRGARLLHLAGAEVRGDLPGAARAAGLRFERRLVYAARARDWLDPPTIGLLARGELDAALFFSPAHATIWRRLIERAALTDRLFPICAIALSAAVGEPLAGLPWRALGVAAAPEVAALIDRLEGPG